MNIVLQLILNPAILSLVAGYFIGSFSRLNFTKKIMEIISVYLIFSIGFKGGLCLGVANQCTSSLYGLAVLGVVLGFIQPFINNIILKKTTKLDKVNSAVIASQYGSISIVTFITAISFLTKRGIAYDTFMSAVAGIMEIPALFSGLILIKNNHHIFDKKFFKSLIGITKSILTCKSIVSIFAGFFVGIIFKNLNIDSYSSFILFPFTLILVIFMLDIGIKIANQKEHVKKISPSLIAFGIYMPVISGVLAILLGFKFVNTLGSLILFALLVASASYIAVPAVMRTQAKGAKEVIYLPLALAITLPFNVLIGIPLFYYLASLFV